MKQHALQKETLILRYHICFKEEVWELRSLKKIKKVRMWQNIVHAWEIFFKIPLKELCHEIQPN